MSDNWSVPSTSSLPQPPSPPPPDNRRIQMVVGAAVAVLLAVAVGLTVGLLRDDPGPVLVDGETPPAPAGGDEAPTDDGAPEGGSVDGGVDTAPSTTDPEPDGGDDDSSDGTADDGAADDAAAELDALLPTLIEFVETERGLTFQEDPVVLVLGNDAFVERFNQVTEEDLAESAEDLENFTGIYHALDILDDDVSIETAIKAFGEAGVIGFYDPETDELVVRGREITPLVRTTIVHELVHALDDQWFNLHRPEYDDREDEIGFGFRAVIEGNARVIEGAYRDTLSASEVAQEEAEGLSLAGDIDFTVLTLPYLDLQFAPYEYGEPLVEELWGAGQETLDGALQDPPDTSEEVMVTGAFRIDAGRDEVAPPPADGEVVEQGVFGQLALQIILATAVDDDAAEAAAGWAGDWFVSWVDGDETCVRADFAMDDEAERDELVAAVERWVDNHDDASTETTGLGLVRLTACG